MCPASSRSLPDLTTAGGVGTIYNHLYLGKSSQMTRLQREMPRQLVAQAGRYSNKLDELTNQAKTRPVSAARYRSGVLRG
jgi:hypothetical protein